MPDAVARAQQPVPTLVHDIKCPQRFFATVLSDSKANQVWEVIKRENVIVLSTKARNEQPRRSGGHYNRFPNSTVATGLGNTEKRQTAKVRNFALHVYLLSKRIRKRT